MGSSCKRSFTCWSLLTSCLSPVLNLLLISTRVRPLVWVHKTMSLYSSVFTKTSQWHSKIFQLQPALYYSSVQHFLQPPLPFISSQFLSNLKPTDYSFKKMALWYCFPLNYTFQEKEILQRFAMSHDQNIILSFYLILFSLNYNCATWGIAKISSRGMIKVLDSQIFCVTNH